MEGEKFEILRGVKQGDPLSSVLFNVALQEIFRHLLWDDRGVDINGKILNNLRFADDVVLIANSKKDLEFMLRDLNEKGKIAGLEINFDKTNIIANTEYRADINIEGRKVKKVEDVIYLGQTISFSNRYEKEIKRRINMSWKKYWSLKRIFKSNFKTQIKSKIFNSCVVPVLSYGSQTWALKTEDKNRIQVTQNKIEKSMINVKQRERIQIKKIKQILAGNNNIVEICLNKKWDWAGHLARSGDNWVTKSTFWYLRYKKRNRGRQKIRWSDDFYKLFTHKMFHQVAQSRPEWQRLRAAFSHSGNKYFGK